MSKLTKYLIIFFIVIGCSKKDVQPETDKRIQIINTYAELGFAIYTDAVTEAKKMQQQINSFLNNPTAEGLELCKQSWKNSRIPYAYTEAYRFYGGPIDGVSGKETYINSWPLDEAAIDYVEGNTISGIINNSSAFPQISETILTDNNQLANEVSVLIGYHAIEFLLWGQDLSTTGPGNRPYTDFIENGTAHNQERRRQYLKIVSDLLVKDLEEVAIAWSPNENNYRKEFTNSSQLKTSLAKILIGLGKYTKGEMAGQRISVALTQNSQEDEHDCFSDYTTQDIKTWQKGLVSIYLGKYTKTDGTVVSGYSLNEFAKERNKTISDNILAKLDLSTAETEKLTLPFDLGISTEPDKSTISALVTNLNKQAESYLNLIPLLDIIREYNELTVE